jgi:hypothetical protein
MEKKIEAARRVDVEACPYARAAIRAMMVP